MLPFAQHKATLIGLVSPGLPTFMQETFKFFQRSE